MMAAWIKVSAYKLAEELDRAGVDPKVAKDAIKASEKPRRGGTAPPSHPRWRFPSSDEFPPPHINASLAQPCRFGAALGRSIPR